MLEKAVECSWKMGKALLRTDEKHSKGPQVQAWIIVEINSLVEMDFSSLAINVGISGHLIEDTSRPLKTLLRASSSSGAHSPSFGCC